MNTLRAKIAVLLVVAIVSVVGVLTVVLFYLLGPPKRMHSLTPIAEQVEMLVAIAKEGRSDVLKFVPQRSPGHVHVAFTQRLRASLAARGLNLGVVVSRDGFRAPLVVSIPMGNKGWLLLPIADMPVQGVPWGVLLRWLALITLGAAAIAVAVANRMVRPLVLLEDAVESVGADAMLLPVFPERGPAEVRATARALNSLSARLKSAVESRMRLVAAAGHDLRTPITRMRLRAEFV